MKKRLEIREGKVVQVRTQEIEEVRPMSTAQIDSTVKGLKKRIADLLDERTEVEALEIKAKEEKKVQAS